MGTNDEKKSVFNFFQSGGCGVRLHRWNLFTQIAKDSDSGTLFRRDLLLYWTSVSRNRHRLNRRCNL
jgi:hypothetical protein